MRILQESIRSQYMHCITRILYPASHILCYLSPFHIRLILILPLYAALSSCGKSGVTDETQPAAGKLVLVIENRVDSLPLKLDTMMFENSSGDMYKVTDLQYFISDFILYRHDGVKIKPANDDGIHYVDARIPSSLVWPLNLGSGFGSFDSVSFTFGICAEKNYSFRYPNPPERDMNWPEILGGGYHYMKMNLLWQNDTMTRSRPFNFHIGIGQIYKGGVINPDSIVSYVQNFFYVTLPSSAFAVGEGQSVSAVLTMNVNRWFTGNNEFEFAAYKNMMMQTQTAMHNACLNGRNAFAIRFRNGEK